MRRISVRVPDDIYEKILKKNKRITEIVLSAIRLYLKS
tara:strand:- start:540 stop:653 length:114 start_codon:yes stop_codon:yes gene_type:complete